MSLIIDIFLAILLISAIGYGIVLNRKIVLLRRDQANLERLAVNFQEATMRAEASVGKLKKAAQSSSQILSEGIDNAMQVRDDLNFLVDRGVKLSDRLESSVRGAENSPTLSESGVGSKSILNPIDLANKFLSTKAQQKFSPKEMAGSNEFSAEIASNGIAKSEAERELLKALRAVS